MFNPTRPLFALRRLRLTTKNGPKDYYKGNRTGAMGRHTRRGRYIVMFEKVRTYIAPVNMEACQLTPFVANRVEKEKWRHPSWETTGEPPELNEGPGSGRLYLEKWKLTNGQF